MRKSLKVKFAVSFSLMIFVALFMFTACLYTYNVSIPRITKYTNSLSELNEFRSNFEEFNSTIEEYLSGSSTDLETCEELSQTLKGLWENIDTEYANSDDEVQASLVKSITLIYTTYIDQIQVLIEMENQTEALQQYTNLYSDNRIQIENNLEKLIAYNYKISSANLDETYDRVQMFQILVIGSFTILFLIIVTLFRMILKDVVKPIQQLARQSQQIANYDFDVENVKVRTKDEIASLVSMFNHMREKLQLMFNSNIKSLQMAEELMVQIQGNEELEKYVEYQKDLNDEIFKEANVDHLTNLMNQNAFIHCTDENIRSIDKNELCALFVLDIDNFKSIDATLGEGADEVLKYTANEMNKAFKDCGFIARWNRDVFVGFISGLPNEEFPYQKCKELNSAMNIHFRYKKKFHPISASIGVCLCTNPLNCENMFQIAQEEVRNVKGAGKNGYHVRSLLEV
ncbi:MAG: diguanylate cyclase [Ruminococcus sp.]|nr:diguanylate cyclase [Ruminococcus sp.]